MDDTLSTTHGPEAAPFVPVEDMQPDDTQAFTAPMHLPQAMQQQAWTEGHDDLAAVDAEAIDGDEPRRTDVATAIRHWIEDHPFAAVGTALGLGLLLARLTR